MLLQYSGGLAETAPSKAPVDFSAVPGVGASKARSRLATAFARFTQALHESRRIQAEREIARHRHLIPPWTPAGERFAAGPERDHRGC
jgi:hypothetical protein